MGLTGSTQTKKFGNPVNRRSCLNNKTKLFQQESPIADEDDDKENVICGDDSDGDESSIRFGTDSVPYAWKNVTKNGWIKKCILVLKLFTQRFVCFYRSKFIDVIL
jgi:hypothetical protein